MKTDANMSHLPRVQPFLKVGALLDGIEATLCNSSTWAEAAGEAFPPMREKEIERVAKLRDSALAYHLRASLACARVMIGEQLGMSADDVHLTRSAEGAPGLENAPGRRVSISRSAGWTLVALGDGRAIGADVEALRAIDWRAMLGMVCSEPEAAAFLALTERQPEQTLRAFFTMWTLKEAVLKATGRGLRAGAKSVVVPVEALSREAPPLHEIHVAGARYAVWSGWEGDLALGLAVDGA